MLLSLAIIFLVGLCDHGAFAGGAADDRFRRLEPQRAVSGCDGGFQDQRVLPVARGDLPRHKSESIFEQLKFHDRGIVRLLDILFGRGGLSEERGWCENAGEDETEGHGSC